MTLDVTQQPQVTWLSTNGKTQVILQFSARDSNNVPLTEDEVEVQLELDGDPIDVESLLNQSSTELEVNLYFAMVLDASFSMTQHNRRAAFPPTESTQTGQQSRHDDGGMGQHMQTMEAMQEEQLAIVRGLRGD